MNNERRDEFFSEPDKKTENTGDGKRVFSFKYCKNFWEAPTCL